jgi:tRNA pseudouridine13 synthase
MLSPGMLYRNQFEITLRRIHVVRPHGNNIAPTQPSIQDAIHGSIQQMRRYGFVNLYGEQRLGIDRNTIPIQSCIGKFVLQQDFWTAINLIIQGDQVDTRNTNASSVDERSDKDEEEEEERSTQDTSQAIKMARKMWNDTQDPVAVLKVLPRDGFNREKIILKGLKRFGKQQPLAVWRCLPYHIRSFYIHAYQSYVWNSVAWERIRKVGARTVMKGDLYYDNGELQIASEPSQVPFSSVVHPLPGTDIRYPENEIGDIYCKILQKDGIDFNAKDAPAESTAKGTYRLLHSNAYNLEWHRIFADGEDERDTLSTAKFTFELDSGCYGTVMLRQLMNPFPK